MSLSIRVAAIVVAVCALFAIASGGSAAAKAPQPYLVVDITGFIGPDCSGVTFTVTNIGGAEQPFGWSLRLVVRKAGIDQTFVGQQPLAPGESRMSLMGTQITAPGTYAIRLSATDVAGESRAGHVTMHLPQSC